MTIKAAKATASPATFNTVAILNRLNTLRKLRMIVFIYIYFLFCFMLMEQMFHADGTSVSCWWNKSFMLEEQVFHPDETKVSRRWNKMELFSFYSFLMLFTGFSLAARQF